MTVGQVAAPTTHRLGQDNMGWQIAAASAHVLQDCASVWVIDAAVDIAWDAFMDISGLERLGLEISQSGNYLEIKPLTVKNDNFLAMAA